VAGKYASLSILDVADNAELHQLLWNLPLFPYMRIEVTPLTTHPSDITATP
jgi:muconolactone D-isomerase